MSKSVIFCTFAGKSYAFRITVYSIQSVSCCIIVGLMIFVSSLTVPYREVTLFVFGAI